MINISPARHRDSQAPQALPSSVDRWRLALLAGSSAADLDAGRSAVRARLGNGAADEPTVGVHLAGAGAGRHRSALLFGNAGSGSGDVGSEKSIGCAVVSQPMPIAFMFPGLGDHHVDMGQDLYTNFTIFRDELDHCAELLIPELGVDIRDVMFHERDAPGGDAPDLDLRRMLAGGADNPGDPRLDRASIAQPALFATEYALARTWQAWGARPGIMIGYSLGEFVAACLAGVLPIEDMLSLVARRAQLIEELPGGGMLAVMLPEAQIEPLLGARLSLSAVNGPEFCVVAGAREELHDLETRLAEQHVITRRVRTSHAVHSTMMEPITGRLTDLVRSYPLRPPDIPYVSNVTGRLITDAEVTDPSYWAQHLRSPVRFADGLREVGPEPVLLEVGPGQNLSSMAASSGQGSRVVVASMRHAMQRQSDSAVLLTSLGRLWLANADLDWAALPALQLADDAPAGIRPEERPLTETERALVATWARLLPNPVGPNPADANFFELGGNSLLATRLILRVSRAFRVELTLRQVYEAPTIAALAATIDGLDLGTGRIQNRQGQSEARFRLPNAIWVAHQGEAETRHFYRDIFEHRTYVRHGIRIPDGACVVDVGANIGLFTLFAHFEAEAVRVVAFEPAPVLFDLLRGNVTEHNVRATLLDHGLSNRDGEASFTFYPLSSGMSTFHPDAGEEKRNLRTIIANQRRAGADEIEQLAPYTDELIDVRLEPVQLTVRLRPLSAVIREQHIERIDLLKIDVQKSELEVLEGILDEDWPKIQQLVLEVHDAGGRVRLIQRMLQHRGFRVIAEQDDLYLETDIHNVYAVRS